MAKNPINLTTLRWVDRRRLWLTTNKLTALGISKIPVYPSTLTGQSSRPTVANRYFTLSWSWLISSGLICFSLGLAVNALVATLTLALTTSFKALTLRLDKALNDSQGGPYVAKNPGTSDMGPLTAEACRLSTDSARVLFSLLGSMDATAPFLPAPKLALEAPKNWGPFTQPALSPCWGLSTGRSNPAKPSFRPYLGEWRRLLDQSTPAKSNGAGSVYLNRTKRTHSYLSPTTRQFGAIPKEGFKPLAGVTTKPYYAYLTSPWVF